MVKGTGKNSPPPCAIRLISGHVARALDFFWSQQWFLIRRRVFSSPFGLSRLSQGQPATNNSVDRAVFLWLS
ncbi:hypothetical protein MLD38_004838 [Melastoma candidum]|uniref:Uncharacterized protein n=1 Tax=Melastoma candidum TaxID=119954 RepID=A0ACB9S8W0_9MYRT|nr:hypothetical protein MLD38_004838 [Melastoma candidum]